MVEDMMWHLETFRLDYDKMVIACDVQTFDASIYILNAVTMVEEIEKYIMIFLNQHII